MGKPGFLAKRMHALRTVSVQVCVTRSAASKVVVPGCTMGVYITLIWNGSLASERQSVCTCDSATGI